MDLLMPGLDGMAATERIKAKAPDVKILILKTYGTSDFISKALSNGADGALMKNSPQQKEILDLIVRGFPNADIAKRFGISVTVVKEHLVALYHKIDASNRTEAVAIALRKHLLKI